MTWSEKRSRLQRVVLAVLALYVVGFGIVNAVFRARPGISYREGLLQQVETGGDRETFQGRAEGRDVTLVRTMEASGAVGLMLSDGLPDGVRSLANLLCRSLIDGVITVFHRSYRSQDGSVVSDGNRWLSPEDVLNMDYLLDNVDGSIPAYGELLPMARRMVRLQGVYRDAIPPERGEGMP